jgi:hypothetical protein
MTGNEVETGTEVGRLLREARRLIARCQTPPDEADLEPGPDPPRGLTWLSPGSDRPVDCRPGKGGAVLP